MKDCHGAVILGSNKFISIKEYSNRIHMNAKLKIWIYLLLGIKLKPAIAFSLKIPSLIIREQGIEGIFRSESSDRFLASDKDWRGIWMDTFNHKNFFNRLINR